MTGALGIHNLAVMPRCDEEDLLRDGFERVHIELDWWDGPREGLADVDGKVHYFQAVWDDDQDDYGDEYYVWPASSPAVAMEREAQTIFLEWLTRYKSATASIETHPGHGGVDARYDELKTRLLPFRAKPNDAIRMTAEWRALDRRFHNNAAGPSYTVKWCRSGQ
ncbi:hypothetical protein GCM10009555_104030 [Acrocarpospora macrocephala]|uniref:Uncharacterized protein n=1 Tax=Acrocarpospora macrocephala TaxID=150177 RepID=A0A5M3WC32_9ACTN|nr:hypothetical protein Amac_000010 [Acrocarpospora macrocephala]